MASYCLLRHIERNTIRVDLKNAKYVQQLAPLVCCFWALIRLPISMKQVSEKDRQVYACVCLHVCVCMLALSSLIVQRATRITEVPCITRKQIFLFFSLNVPGKLSIQVLTRPFEIFLGFYE